MIWAHSDRFNYKEPNNDFNSFSEYARIQMEDAKKKQAKNRFKSVNTWADQSMLHKSIRNSPQFQATLQSTLGINWKERVEEALKNDLSGPETDGSGMEGTFFLTEADLPSPDTIRRKPTAQNGKKKKKFRPFRDMIPGPGAHDIAKSLIKPSFNKSPAVLAPKAPKTFSIPNALQKKYKGVIIQKKQRTQVHDDSILAMQLAANSGSSSSDSQHIFGAHMNHQKYARSMSAPPGGRRPVHSRSAPTLQTQPRIVVHDPRNPKLVKTTSKLGIDRQVYEPKPAGSNPLTNSRRYPPLSEKLSKRWVTVAHDTYKWNPTAASKAKTKGTMSRVSSSKLW